MNKPLTSVAPENMAEDEQQIGRGYRSGWMTSVVIWAIIFATAHFAELKWVVAVGFACVAVMVNAAENRLYDLCIRLRRTNTVLGRTNTLLNETRLPSRVLDS